MKQLISLVLCICIYSINSMEKKETLPSFAELIASIGNPELITIMPAQPSNNSLRLPNPGQRTSARAIRTPRKRKTPDAKGVNQFNFPQFPDEKTPQPSAFQFYPTTRNYTKK